MGASSRHDIRQNQSAVDRDDPLKAVTLPLRWEIHALEEGLEAGVCGGDFGRGDSVPLEMVLTGCSVLSQMLKIDISLRREDVPASKETEKRGGRGNKGFTHEQTLSARDMNHFRLMDQWSSAWSVVRWGQRPMRKTWRDWRAWQESCTP